jgi:hypothetical protein
MIAITISNSTNVNADHAPAFRRNAQRRKRRVVADVRWKAVMATRRK